MSVRRIANLKPYERVEAVRPWVGRVALVRYRGGSASDFDNETTGRIIGCSFPRTNGNSTGDLIVAPLGSSWRFGGDLGGEWELLSISLANLGRIEEPG